MLKNVLRFAVLVEIGTGLVAIVAPRFLVLLLLGEELANGGVAVTRCFGVAIFALGMACWPGDSAGTRLAPAYRAMLVYNALIAVLLAYLFGVDKMGGVLLWPAIALHAAVASVMLLRRREIR